MMKIGKKHIPIVWGEDPAVSGPRNWFRHSLMIHEVVSRVKKGSYILDAGCGGGELLIRLGKMGYRGVGIDGASGCVLYTNECIRKEGLENKLSARTANMLHLPFSDSTFHAVVCGEVLEHIQKDTDALHEIVRVLKPGGYLFVTVPADPSAWNEIDDISSHVRRYTKEMLTARIVHAGTSIIVCKQWGFPLNELWNTYLFLPFIRQKINNKENVTASHSIRSVLMKSSFVKQCIATFFSFDTLFDFTNKGKALLCVARKKGSA
jgi:ubiquinone/menaquinone biosynthesis C-methylase UbiE